MSKGSFEIAGIAAATLCGLMASAPIQAANFGDWMNPGKWFGSKNNDRDYYYGRNYGYPGYGYPGYGYPGYAPGWGYPGYGYGVAPYGYPGQMGNQNNNTPAPAPVPQ